VRNHKGSHLWGGADRTGDPILTNVAFHAMHIILSLKLGDHEGLALFVHGCLLKRTLLTVLPVILIRVLIRAFLSPVPVYCRIQSGTSWCCPAGRQRLAPSSGKLSVGFLYFVSFLLLLILLVLLEELFSFPICESLSLFLLFPFCWWEGGVNREHLPLCLLPPCSKRWHCHCKNV